MGGGVDNGWAGLLSAPSPKGDDPSVALSYGVCPGLIPYGRSSGIPLVENGSDDILWAGDCLAEKGWFSGFPLVVKGSLLSTF